MTFSSVDFIKTNTFFVKLLPTCLLRGFISSALLPFKFAASNSIYNLRLQTFTIATITITIANVEVQFVCQMLNCIPSLLKIEVYIDKFQWRIQDFPEEGALTPKAGAPTYYLANFSRKLHENEEIWDQRGGARPSRPPLDPPLSLYNFFPI